MVKGFTQQGAVKGFPSGTAKGFPSRTAKGFPSRVAKGFVLVMTIWVLAALSLIVVYVANAVDQMQHAAIQLQEENNHLFDKMATESAALYLVATRPMTYGGISTSILDARSAAERIMRQNFSADVNHELRFDGRAYEGAGDTYFDLQDEGALISLRGRSNDRLIRLLQQSGVESVKGERLIALLADYTDRDRRISMSGAEYEDYIARGLLEPTDRFLSSPLQLLNVLDWSGIMEPSTLFAFLQEVTIHPGNRENYNLMTKRGFQSLDGLDSAVVDKIIQLRKNILFTSLRDVNDAVGTLLPTTELMFSRFPSPSFRLRIADFNSRQEDWIGITLTPLSNLAPWQIEYRVVFVTPVKNEQSDEYSRVVEKNPAPVLFR